MPKPRQGSRGRVLLVEDNVLNQVMAVGILSKLGHAAPGGRGRPCTTRGSTSNGVPCPPDQPRANTVSVTRLAQYQDHGIPEGDPGGRRGKTQASLPTDEG